MYLNFEGMSAVVTGAGGVLCSEMAKGLGENGFTVALLDIDLDAAESVAKGINESGGKAQAFYCDVLDKESVKKSASLVEEAIGPIRVLVNGAGGNNERGNTTEHMTPKDLENPDLNDKNLFKLDPDGFRFVLDLNLMGAFIPTQAFLPQLSKHEDASVINIASMASYRPMTQVPAYSAAKAAVSNLTQFLAVHLAPVNIRVNAIAPGYFLTKQSEKLLTNPDGTLTSRSQRVINHSPSGRYGKPKELVGTLLYLCDKEMSGFVTGVVIPVDGGFIAYSGV
ncbi:SDR family oxidoreductase [Alkalibacter mobilis]|uniref:SDR family oxidoreductase n=1 Tax=Alkalibacter mobilis TaxID=2787712 RepID=UPI00189DFD6C|nr:SDR family oxidoreductase [Alkalibacter mobilis]MBF7097302.1 SDR family oxidoreductase [Alkalibacter mobilis]